MVRTRAACLAIVPAVLALLLSACGGPPVMLTEKDREEVRQSAPESPPAETAKPPREGPEEKTASPRPAPAKPGPGDSAPQDVISGKIIAVDRPMVTVVMFFGRQPQVGDEFIVYRGDNPVGKVRIESGDGTRWRARIIQETEQGRVADQDRVIGRTAR